MNDRSVKVLIIEDEDAPRESLEAAFCRSSDPKFEVRTARNSAEAEIEIQQAKFDVITIDLKLQSEQEAGLRLFEEGMILASCPDAVKIVVTGYATYERCVQAVRQGAWDFILKTGSYEAKVVQSAVARLNDLEEVSKQEDQIFEEWLPKNEAMLQERFPDEYIAVRDGEVIAHARTMIGLGTAMRSAQAGRKPFILRVKKGEPHD
jgi:DNA-binding NtrC family response regulator